MRTPRQEELGKRLVAMVRSGEERREELNTWELANINCKVKDIIEDVKKEGSGSINNQGIDVKEDGIVAEQQRMKNMEAGELGGNEVEESPDEVENEVDNEVDNEVETEVDNDEVDNMEEISSAGKVAEGEELETGVSLRLAADASPAGSLIISFIAFN